MWKVLKQLFLKCFGYYRNKQLALFIKLDMKKKQKQIVFMLALTQSDLKKCFGVSITNTSSC